MKDLENMDFNGMEELDDEQLDNVSGGVSIGDVVRAKSWEVKYCPRCGKLLLDYEATITGVRGTVDGKTLYWITRSCCGYKSSVSETAIIG